MASTARTTGNLLSAEFGIEDFARGFVAALVSSGKTSLQPKQIDQRKALYDVWEFLRAEVEAERNSNATGQWFKQIVRLRNALAPGTTGAHDHFETALRDLQLSFTESPNPHYDDILFTVSKPFARSELGRLSEQKKRLVEEAARIFLESTNKHADDRRPD